MGWTRLLLLLLAIALAGRTAAAATLANPPAPAAAVRTASPIPAAPAASAAPATREAAKVLAEADRILANVRTTVYAHQTKVDESDGLYEMDCSGLVRYVLRRISPKHLDAVVAGTGRKVPTAMDFYEFFRGYLESAQPWNGWTVVLHLADARPGDLIAWRRPLVQPGESTGHIMIIAETPVAESADVFRVVVIDSTVTPHDSDTRGPVPDPPKPSTTGQPSSPVPPPLSQGQGGGDAAAPAVAQATQTAAAPAAANSPAAGTGVGRGMMWFKVDAAGAPVAYRRNSQSPFRTFPHAIGRLVALPSAP